MFLSVTLDCILSYRQQPKWLPETTFCPSWPDLVGELMQTPFVRLLWHLLFGSRVLMSSLVQICSHQPGWQAAEQLYAADFWHSMHYTVAMASSSHQHTTTQHMPKGRMSHAAADCWKSPWMASVPGLLLPLSTSPNFQKADLVWPVSNRHFIPVESWMTVCLCGQQESHLWPYYPASISVVQRGLC